MARIRKANSTDEVADFPGGAIARWMRHHMDKRELTYQRVAEKAGVNYQTVRNIYLGHVENPRRENRRRIAEAIGVDIPKRVERDIERESGIKGIGELIDFDPYQKDDIPKCGGIYVLYDIAGRPLYVGEGQKISDRVNSHKDKFWFKEPLVASGAYLEIEETLLRRQIETVLIRFLKNNAVINKQNVARK